MPTKIVRPLKDVDNTALLNAIRRDASLEYRQRVPETTDGKIQKTIESIMEFQGIKNENQGGDDDDDDEDRPVNSIDDLFE